MTKVFLRDLCLLDKEQFLEANNENWGNFSFCHYYTTLADSNFKKFVKVLPELSKGLHLPNDRVPCTFLFAFNKKGELVGRTSIRHELNDFLIKVGGHIGYGVVPKYRKKGYATEILKESLRYIKINIHSINRVLVTCDEGNIGSQKTIEKNGGELENIIDIPGECRKMRFWIEI